MCCLLPATLAALLSVAGTFAADIAFDVSALPTLTPPADAALKLVVHPNRSAILPNGTVCTQEIAFAREDSRGLLVGVHDEADWAFLNQSFRSVPFRHAEGEDPERWFTQEHGHDSEALAWPEMWHGGEFEHQLVRQDRPLAQDRGTRYLLFDPQEYTGREIIEFEVLQEQWLHTKWWTNYLVTM